MYSIPRKQFPTKTSITPIGKVLPDFDVTSEDTPARTIPTIIKPIPSQ